MLPSLNRLKKKNDFDRVFRQGKGFKSSFIAIKTSRNKLKNSRFGFVVSSKVSKKAVVRNRIKRRLRESVKERMGKIKKGFDVVIIAFPKTATQDFEKTSQEVEKLFKKAKLL